MNLIKVLYEKIDNINNVYYEYICDMGRVVFAGINPRCSA